MCPFFRRRRIHEQGNRRSPMRSFQASSCSTSSLRCSCRTPIMRKISPYIRVGAREPIFAYPSPCESHDSCARSPALQCFDAPARTESFALFATIPTRLRAFGVIGLPTTLLSIEPVLSKAQGNRKPMTILNRQLMISDGLDMAGHIPRYRRGTHHYHFRLLTFSRADLPFRTHPSYEEVGREVRKFALHCGGALWSASIGGDKETCSNPRQNVSIPVAESVSAPSNIVRRRPGWRLQDQSRRRD